MTVFEINSVPYGSTGRIMFQIANTVKATGSVAYTSASFTKSRGEHFPETYYRIGGAIGKLSILSLQSSLVDMAATRILQLIS